MKKCIALVFIPIMMMIACQKKNNTDYPIQGKWAITSYFINDTDRSSQFAPFTFIFSNGKLTVDNTGMMNMCSYSAREGIYHFNMTGVSGKALEELDGDWMLTNLTDSTCSFIIYRSSRDCSFKMHKRGY